MFRASFPGPFSTHCSETAAGVYMTNSNVFGIHGIKANLHVRHGGLEIRRVTSLARPAYLALAADYTGIFTVKLTAVDHKKHF